jgi:predicted transcriptional regulator
MDTRLICLEVMRIIKERHPRNVSTYIIYNEIDASKRSVQRQIKFLFEQGLICKHHNYKVGLNIET